MSVLLPQRNFVESVVSLSPAGLQAALYTGAVAALEEMQVPLEVVPQPHSMQRKPLAGLSLAAVQAVLWAAAVASQLPQRMPLVAEHAPATVEVL